jgi:hypothetical protein
LLDRVRDGFAHFGGRGLGRQLGAVVPGGIDDLLKLLRHMLMKSLG